MDKENIKEVFGNEDEKETADHTADESKAEKDSKHEDAPSVGGQEQSEEKTYTQAQVDAMMAKARKKYTKSDVKEEPAEDTKDEQVIPQAQRDLSTGITVEKLAQAELKAEMAIQGINPSKVARAVRLIDVADVIDETGQYSEKMAQAAIEELLKDWPELKQTSQQEGNSFEFGAPEQEEQDSIQNQKSAISKIFGN